MLCSSYNDGIFGRYGLVACMSDKESYPNYRRLSSSLAFHASGMGLFPTFHAHIIPYSYRLHGWLDR